MNASDTARIVNLIVSTWPSGVKGHVWTDTIGTLEQARAHDAYRELRDTEERPPSVARFLAKYHALSTDPGANRVHCALCDGTGTVPVHTDRCPATPERDCGGCAVTACRCTAGQTMAPVIARIVDHADRPVRR